MSLVELSQLPAREYQDELDRRIPELKKSERELGDIAADVTFDARARSEAAFLIGLLDGEAEFEDLMTASRSSDIHIANSALIALEMILRNHQSDDVLAGQATKRCNELAGIGPTRLMSKTIDCLELMRSSTSIQPLRELLLRESPSKAFWREGFSLLVSLDPATAKATKIEVIANIEGMLKTLQSE